MSLTKAPCAPYPDAEAIDLKGVLDLLDFGVVVLDGSGGVTFANQTAVQECRAQGALRLSSGRLEVQDDGCNPAFQRAVQAARRGLRSMLHLEGKDVNRSVILAPLASSNEGAPLVLLIVGRRQEVSSLTVQMFANSFDLTLAETSVLRGLCQGKTPRQLAQSSNVAICTIRTHILNLRHKTGTLDIRGLLRQVHCVPSIAPLQVHSSTCTGSSEDATPPFLNKRKPRATP